MILKWCVMGSFQTRFGLLWSHCCRPRRVVRDARGLIIGGRWRASRGGTGRVHRGGTCRLSSARGKRYGNVIFAGHRTAPTNGSSMGCTSRDCCSRASTRSWSSCCRWTPPWSVPINTPRERADPRLVLQARRPLPRTQGAPPNYTNLPVEPADHAIGRSRGGLSTKIHTLTDDRTRPVAVILTPGQSGDNPQLEPLLDLHQQQYPMTRRPHFRLLADKAYSHPSTREKLRGRRIPHTIPERQDQKDRRKAKGTKGGRPPGFDQLIYAKRNTVERGYLRLKQWRGIATRYDKHALTFLGGVILATTVIHLRVN